MELAQIYQQKSTQELEEDLEVLQLLNAGENWVTSIANNVTAIQQELSSRTASTNDQPQQ